MEGHSSPSRNRRNREPHESTKVKLRSLEYVWEMEEFSRLRRLARMGALPVDGIKVRSATFGSDAAGFWYLEVTPGKLVPGMVEEEESDGGTIIELYMDVSQTAEAMAEFCFSFLDESGRIMEGSQIGTNEFQLFKADDDPGPCHGCRLPAMELDRFVRESRLILKCDMRVFLGVISNPLHALRHDDQNEDGSNHLLFRQPLYGDSESKRRPSLGGWQEADYAKGYSRKNNDRSFAGEPPQTPVSYPVGQPAQPTYVQPAATTPAPVRTVAPYYTSRYLSPVSPGAVRYGSPYPYGGSPAPRRVVSSPYSYQRHGGAYYGGYSPVVYR